METDFRKIILYGFIMREEKEYKFQAREYRGSETRIMSFWGKTGNFRALKRC